MYLNHFPHPQTNRGKVSHGQSVPPLLMPVAGAISKRTICRSALITLDRHEREVDAVKAAHLAYSATNKPTSGGNGRHGYV